MTKKGEVHNPSGKNTSKSPETKRAEAVTKQKELDRDTTGRNPDKPVPGSQAYADKRGWSNK